MAKTYGICSECPTPLTHPKAKTCSAACRARRSRRLRYQKKEANQASLEVRFPESQKEVREAVSERTVKQAAQAVAQRELTPIVREAITEDVLEAISEMMGLAPLAVQRLTEDMDHPNAQIRQRAYALWFQYTVGRKEFTDEQGADSRVINVNFELPRPGENPSEEQETEAVLDAVELRVCDICQQEKEASHFIANSDRCSECQEQLVVRVKERFGLDGEH